MDANEIDQPVFEISGDHSCGLLNSSPIASGVAHCLRIRRKVIDIFRREQVFQEKQPKLLHILGKLHGHARRKALMHIMQQPDLIAQFLAAGSKSFSVFRMYRAAGSNTEP